MSRGRRALRLGALGVGLLAAASACATVLGIDQEYVQRPADAAPSQTDGSDAGNVDACTGDATSPSCAVSCGAGQFFCAATGSCVARCKTDCLDASIECLACDSVGVVKTAACLDLASAGSCGASPLVHCACRDAGDCPGPSQVCTGGQCLACGEQGSNMLPCAGGKRCDTGGKGPDQLTCH